MKRIDDLIERKSDVFEWKEASQPTRMKRIDDLIERKSNVFEWKEAFQPTRMKAKLDWNNRV